MAALGRRSRKIPGLWKVKERLGDSTRKAERGLLKKLGASEVIFLPRPVPRARKVASHRGLLTLFPKNAKL